MRLAYADPPYPGQARKHYSHDPRCAEVDHAELLRRLSSEFDGWALSTSSVALDLVKALAPKGTRVGVWVKPFASFKPGVNPAYCWEPVLFWPCRKRDRSEPTVRDFISCNITLRKGLVGVKPEPVCNWIFDLMGATADCEFHDLFPGSGAVSRAWTARFGGRVVEGMNP